MEQEGEKQRESDFFFLSVTLLALKEFSIWKIVNRLGNAQIP